MTRLSRNQSGFSAIEAFLMLVIVGMIGFVGWYVLHAKNTVDKNLASSSSTSSIIKKSASTAKPTTKNSTAGWDSIDSTSGKFSLKYPHSWVQPACNADLPSIVALAPDVNSVLKCGTEFQGQIEIISAAIKNSNPAYDFSSGYKDLVIKHVTVDGIAGKRTSAIASGQQGSGSFADGTIVVEYLFSTNGIIYAAHYQQYPTGAASTDVLSDFDLIVTQTLKFDQVPLVGGSQMHQ